MIDDCFEDEEEIFKFEKGVREKMFDSLYNPTLLNEMFGEKVTKENVQFKKEQLELICEKNLGFKVLVTIILFENEMIEDRFEFRFKNEKQEEVLRHTQ